MTDLTPGTVYYVEIMSITAAGETVADPRRTRQGPCCPAGPGPPSASTASGPRAIIQRYPDFTGYFGGGFTLPTGSRGTAPHRGELHGRRRPPLGLFSLPLDFGYSRLNSKQLRPAAGHRRQPDRLELDVEPDRPIQPQRPLRRILYGRLWPLQPAAADYPGHFVDRRVSATPGGDSAAAGTYPTRTYWANTRLMPADTTSAAASLSAGPAASSSSPRPAFTA